MKTNFHVRLAKEDLAVLEDLKNASGLSESALICRGLRLLRREMESQRSALEVAGKSAGRFAGGPKDLSTRREHLAEFGR